MRCVSLSDLSERSETLLLPAREKYVPRHELNRRSDLPAINSLADRTDGKVAQALIGDSEEDGVRLVHTITRKIVEPDAK
jgi:hypothetical protein